MAKNILILSVRAGFGHIKAANALEQAIKKYYPDNHVNNVNALDYTNHIYSLSISHGYENISRRLPSVWGMIYDSFEEKGFEKRAKRISRIITRINTRPLLKYIEDIAPDRIVCTHFMPAEILSHAHMKKNFNIPIDVIVTDYDVHTIWVHPGINRYFVGSDETAYILRSRFSGKYDVIVSGIPVQEEFHTEIHSKKTMRKKIGVSETDNVVLVLSGGAGLIQIDEIVEKLAETNKTITILASGGNNVKLGEKLQRIALKYPGHVRVFGYVDNIHEYMKASDLIITKSGGLTVSECFAAGIPMIIARPIPGQEERNAVYIVENGAGLWAHTPDNIVYKANKLLSDRLLLNDCAEASKRLGKIDAAKLIAKMVVN